MVYLNQKQELSYVNHRRKLQAPLSFLETIDENSVLEFVYEEPEQEPCGMVYLNQEQESTYVNHRRKLQAPLSFLDTIDKDSVLEFVYKEPGSDIHLYPCTTRVRSI